MLTGKVLGILGVGNIGSRVGQLAHAWGMEVIGYDIKQAPEFASKLANYGIRLTNFDEIITTADYISVHVPLDNLTQHMIDAEVLSRMKQGSYLINLARGGVVDEEALYQELTTHKRLRGAALDVHEDEGRGKISILSEFENVILTPHIGAMTIDSQREIGEQIIKVINSMSLSD
jgi:phosphoglycerate dehydrogenase-like enzyme